MTDKEVLLELLYRAFLDIRIASSSQDISPCFILADVFHTIPLQINIADKGEKSYAEIIATIQKNCERRNYTPWFDHTMSTIAMRHKTE